MNTSRIFLCLSFALILWQGLSGQLSLAQVFLLIWGLILSAHDLKTHSYPLWIWAGGTCLLLCHFPITASSLILFCLAILAEIKAIGIGSGDFFYLASLSLTLSSLQILWLIQVASLLGISLLYAQKKTRQELAFIPCLFLAHLLILGLGQFF